MLRSNGLILVKQRLDHGDRENRPGRTELRRVIYPRDQPWFSFIVFDPGLIVCFVSAAAVFLAHDLFGTVTGNSIVSGRVMSTPSAVSSDRRHDQRH